MTANVAKIFGISLIALGVYITYIQILEPGTPLLDTFKVDGRALRNLYVLMGICALVGGFSNLPYLRFYMKLIAFECVVLVVLGLIYLNSDIFGFIANNPANILLNGCIGIAAFLIGRFTQKGHEGKFIIR